MQRGLPLLASLPTVARCLLLRAPRQCLAARACPALRWLSSPAPAAGLSEAQFHHTADATLEGIEQCMASLEDSTPDFDLTFAMGVLTLRLGSKGTYVLNKQAPNRQIWWSSPLSGPRRYHWDAASSRWLNTRDSHCMMEALQGELQGLLAAPEFKLRRAPAPAGKAQ
jgi:frataxin